MNLFKVNGLYLNLDQVKVLQIKWDEAKYKYRIYADDCPISRAMNTLPQAEIELGVIAGQIRRVEENRKINK